jgi:sulfatase modifying factor 1
MFDNAAPDAGGDAPVESGASCVGTGGPVAVPAGAFCIDSTEVTNKQYAAFLATSPSTSGQIPECGWNSSFAPAKNPPPGSDNAPVVQIDWCDAYAFCKWSGKHLCGAMDGGALPLNSIDDPNQDQWFVACSHGGAAIYPYATAFDPSACNGPEQNSGAPQPASSFPKCVGGFPGIFDMVGNVDEWINSCGISVPPDGGQHDPALDQCERRSGSFEDPTGSTQTCDFERSGSRNEVDLDIGFRCCSAIAP